MICQTSDADESHFFLREDERFTNLVVYADELCLVEKENDIIDDIISWDIASFEARSPERPDWCFEMATGNSDKIIKLQNGLFIKRRLAEYGMDQCKPVLMPLLAGLDLIAMDKFQLSPATRYPRLVGSLMHLSNTARPEGTLAVQYLTECMHSRTADLSKAGVHLLGYMRGTLNYE